MHEQTFSEQDPRNSHYLTRSAAILALAGAIGAGMAGADTESHRSEQQAVHVQEADLQVVSDVERRKAELAYEVTNAYENPRVTSAELEPDTDGDGVQALKVVMDLTPDQAIADDKLMPVFHYGTPAFVLRGADKPKNSQTTASGYRIDKDYDPKVGPDVELTIPISRFGVEELGGQADIDIYATSRGVTPTVGPDAKVHGMGMTMGFQYGGTVRVDAEGGGLQVELENPEQNPVTPDEAAFTRQR